VTSISYLKNYERLAAGSTDRSITFYDLNKSNETISNPVSRINDLKGIPLTMDYLESKNIYAVGDDQGYLRLYKLEENWHICNSRMDCHRSELTQDENSHLSHISDTDRLSKPNLQKGLKNLYKENLEV
jgi:hypothetical protein